METKGYEIENAREVALFFKALADENRLRIILCLASEKDGTLSVSEVVRRLGLSQPLVSHHLKELRRDGILTFERKGPFVYYRLENSAVLDLLEEASELIRGQEGS